MISTSRTSAFQISGSAISSHKNIQEALWSERDGRADRKMTTSDGYCHLCQEYRKDHQPAKALWPDHSAERGQLLLRIYSPENHGVYPEPLREKNWWLIRERTASSWQRIWQILQSICLMRKTAASSWNTLKAREKGNFWMHSVSVMDFPKSRPIQECTKIVGLLRELF